MKELITVRDVQERAARGETSLVISRQTIITPSARDAVRELGMDLVEACQTGPVADRRKGGAPQAAVSIRNEAAQAGEIIEQVCRQEGSNCPDPELVAKVVKEVLACLGGQVPQQPAIERDEAGLRLIRGRTVACQPFDTGKPGDRVALLDLLPVKESPRMAAGFMTMEKCSFDWELRYDEYDYIIEGTLEITINGNTYHGKAGDVFYIPSGSRISFGCPDKVKFFYVTYPANWQEQ